MSLSLGRHVHLNGANGRTSLRTALLRTALRAALRAVHAALHAAYVLTTRFVTPLSGAWAVSTSSDSQGSVAVYELCCY